MITQLQQLRRTATVNSVTPPTANVYIGDDPSQDFDLPYVNQPQVGDTVLLSGNQGDYIIVGPIDTGAAPTTYVPSWTNLAVNNGTQVAEYSIAKKWAYLRIGLLFGSTTAITGAVSVSLPFTTANDLAQDILLKVSYQGGAAPTGGFCDVPANSSTLTFWLPSNATPPFIYNRLGSVGITMGALSQIITQGVLRTA